MRSHHHHGALQSPPPIPTKCCEEISNLDYIFSLLQLLPFQPQNGGTVFAPTLRFLSPLRDDTHWITLLLRG